MVYVGRAGSRSWLGVTTCLNGAWRGAFPWLMIICQRCVNSMYMYAMGGQKYDACISKTRGYARKGRE